MAPSEVSIRPTVLEIAVESSERAWLQTTLSSIGVSVVIIEGKGNARSHFLRGCFDF